MKKTSLLFIAMALSTILFAQKPVIAFDITSHDFGKIEEEEGKATFVFNFTNKGNAPMVVSRVQASCGCTTPTWTKEPIEPGRKGSITVTYNPVGRPGAFSKSIAVYSNASEEQVNLMIRGEVIPKVTSDNESMPLVMGDLRLKNKIVQMNNIEKGKSQVRVLEIQNGSNNDVRTTIESLAFKIRLPLLTKAMTRQQQQGQCVHIEAAHRVTGFYLRPWSSICYASGHETLPSPLVHLV